jgi:lysozyme
MARSVKKKKNRFLMYLLVLLFVGAALLFAYLYRLDKETTMIRYREFGIAIPSNYKIHGIDVSRYQQRIDWKAVKDMNIGGIRIEFAFIKATEGTGRKDFLFARNWYQAKKAGIPRGAYHFFTPSRDGVAQAHHFIRQVQLEPGDLPPVLDVEQSNGVARAIIQQRVREWLQEVETAYHVKPILYTNVHFYERYLEGAFEDYPLWVAHYLQPHAPRIGRDWQFWQHSESGQVNGIKGKVDFNVFRGDSIQFAHMLIK